MPARLPSLQPATRIRKRVRRLVTSLQAQIALPAPTPADIHQLRRNTKKLRAWLKLRRSVGRMQDARHMEGLLRGNAARFAAERDATVRLQTLEQLHLLAGSRQAVPRLTRCRALLMDNPPPARTEPDDLAHQQLEQALQHLLAVEPVPEQPSVLEPALRRTYRKARKRLRKARASGKVEDLHRFRRWAKYLCYQLELVCTLERGALAKLHSSLDTLCTRLGTWHDLVVLGESLRALHEPATHNDQLAAELEVAESLCLQAQRRLLTRCLRVAGTSFKIKAALFPSA